MTKIAKANRDKKRIPHEASSWNELSSDKKSDGQSEGGKTRLNKVKKEKVKKNGNKKEKATFKKVVQSNEDNVIVTRKQGKKKTLNKTTPIKNESSDIDCEENNQLFESRDTDEAMDTSTKKRKHKGKTIEAGCYRCHEKDHGVANCPLIKEGTFSMQLCFKCGSTEHKSKFCKSGPKDSFPFAICMLCDKKGHIARFCPNNKKGFFPFGGECAKCGSSEHGRDDCPKTVKNERAKLIEEGFVIDRQSNNHSADAIAVDDNVGKKPKAKKVAESKTVKF